MDSSEPKLRQRHVDPTKSAPTEIPVRAVPPQDALTPSQLAKQEDNAFSWVDMLRFLTFIILLSSLVSYFITKESFVWNIERPKFTRPEVIKSWIEGPKQLTDAELAQYDGTDPTKPIYLAINGTIYDVSVGARHYGPGGSYHFFAGADSSRSFVTNCFQEDRTPDMRGVEQMFIPQDDPEIDDLFTSGELKALKEQEMRKAKKEVHKALKHWVDFFENSSKYTKVGRVKREKGWEEKGPKSPLCAQAEGGRPKREPPHRV
ncbi:putative membrane steroid-binding protein 2 [Calycina marina]|uniref:Membrane steroid-binding protein 2 n=1 Tax=Calycina marina TaxID=1763456 RepID=A0A9P8CGX6_9HELO|nr:putative membrane steroid-binding protein 2 [Calycina marina]